MLDDIRFFGVVAGVICLYYAKALFETWQSIHQSENHVLYVLAALPPRRMLGIMAEHLAGVLLPGILYAGVIAGYSLLDGTWHVWALMGFHVGLLGIASFWLVFEVRNPRERIFRKRFTMPWMHAWTYSIAHLYVSLLLQNRRTGVWISKGLMLLLLAVTLWVQGYDPMPVKGIYLIILCLACLQSLIPFWLHELSQTQCQWLRNFPRPLLKRYGDYVLGYLLLSIPELLLISGLTGFLGLPVAWTLYYLLAVLAIYLLATAALHYEPLTMESFLKYLFGVFAVLFFAILFAIPQWVLYPFVIAFAAWIFVAEYDTWEG